MRTFPASPSICNPRTRATRRHTPPSADRRSLRRLIPFTLACLLTARAGAQTNPTEPSIGDLKQMSVEQLMDIQVTSVGKQPENWFDAPASIDVITNDDILRFGATSIPEALQLADNLEVAQENSHDWAISARGFNANLSDKLLVLIDGRAVYSPLYGGVLWNVQDYLLEDIDRIEVISGPGGTLWGANAVNGVINITSKSARDTQGVVAEAGGGTQLEDFAAFRYGAILAPDVYYRVYAQYSYRGSEELNDGSSANDSIEMTRGGFRIDSYAAPKTILTLQGDFYSGTEFLGPSLGDSGLNGGDVLGRWTRTLDNDSEMSLQAYYDRAHLSQPFAASPAMPPYYSGFPLASLTDDLDTYDLDFQHRFHLGGRNAIVWGLGYRFTHELDEDISIVRFTPPSLDQNLYSGFVQDEITLRPDVHFTLGTKLEHNDYTGFETEPSARISWNFAPGEMLWSAVSRAVRTPSRYDHDLEVVTGLSNPPAPYMFPAAYLAGSSDFTSESVIAYELGYRAEIGRDLSLSASTYYNNYSDIRSTAQTPVTATYPFPYPVVFQNGLKGDTYGLEVSANYQPLDWWRLHAGYNLIREDIQADPGYMDATGALNETADPENQIFFRSSMDLPYGLQFDAAWRWIDAFTIDNGPTSGPVAGTVPSYQELNARLAWTYHRNLEFSVVGQNLLHPRHVEYGYPSPTREEIGRSVFGKVEWRY